MYDAKAPDLAVQQSLQLGSALVTTDNEFRQSGVWAVKKVESSQMVVIMKKAFGEFWAPSGTAGFVPLNLPFTNEQISSSCPEVFGWLASVVPTVGTCSDARLEQILQSAPVPDRSLFQSLSPECCEGLLRSYAVFACHRIHRPYFSRSRELPSCLAVPLWELAELVGRPPTLTYASYVLGNLSQSLKTRATADEISVACSITGTPDEILFIAVHLAVESAGGEVVRAIQRIAGAAGNVDDHLLERSFSEIDAAMRFAVKELWKISGRMDPVIFRDVIRPYLNGYEGVVLRGVDGEPQLSYVGETGAQSGMIRAVDAVLAPNHAAKTALSMSRFLECAPPAHRQFILFAEKLGNSLLQQELSDDVRDARRSALASVAEFRRAHLEIVKEYLIPGGRKLANRGTGGTEFEVWLQDLIDDTDQASGK